ncbi:hypothetical protein DSO57_1019223 [Entomophthora muscae]|uniref:Uncharacterized protein n=1 Tax=Entomophthora muscae TaxID=34485 RepID=A0ACC2TET5_9FUNG|nr:hypothetical protein DSO57_1019223 [Entomophthora muscae]
MIQNGGSRSKAHDMEMFVKACNDCVYAGSYGEDEKSIDIINTISHEMGHGLGFTSKFAEGSMCDPDGISIRTSYTGKYILSYVPTSLFDTHLYTEDKPLHNMFQKLHSTRSYPQPPNTETDCSNKTLLMLNKLLATPNSIYFKTTKGSHVYVETSLKLGGDKTNHMDSGKYYTTLDFLMVPYGVYHGYNLKQFTRPEDWSTAPFGELTLEVFETLGYTVNLNPDPNRSQLALYLQMKENKLLFNHSQQKNLY